MWPKDMKSRIKEKVQDRSISRTFLGQLSLVVITFKACLRSKLIRAPAEVKIVDKKLEITFAQSHRAAHVHLCTVCNQEWNFDDVRKYQDTAANVFHQFLKSTFVNQISFDTNTWTVEEKKFFKSFPHAGGILSIWIFQSFLSISWSEIYYIKSEWQKHLMTRVFTKTFIMAYHVFFMAFVFSFSH